MNKTAELDAAANDACYAPIFLSDLADVYGHDHLHNWLAQSGTRASFAFVADQGRSGPWHGHDALVICRRPVQSPWWSQVQHLRGQALVLYARTSL